MLVPVPWLRRSIVGDRGRGVFSRLGNARLKRFYDSALVTNGVCRNAVVPECTSYPIHLAEDLEVLLSNGRVGLKGLVPQLPAKRVDRAMSRLVNQISLQVAKRLATDSDSDSIATVWSRRLVPRTFLKKPTTAHSERIATELERGLSNVFDGSLFSRKERVLAVSGKNHKEIFKPDVVHVGHSLEFPSCPLLS